MPQCKDLTEGQKKLYDKLENAIKNEQDITPILEEIKKEGVLKEVLTTANITEKLEDGTKHTLTPLGYAMCFNDSEEKIKAILDVAKDNNMLEKVLTTPNIEVKFSDDNKRTLTPLGFAMCFDDSEEEIKAILDVAEKNSILKEVFVGIEEYDHKRLKGILETLKNQEQNEEQKTKIDGWLEILAKSISKTEKNIANNKGER